MAITDAYATAAQYRLRGYKLGSASDGRDSDDQILIDLKADAELIDSWSYRTFHKHAEDTKTFMIPGVKRSRFDNAYQRYTAEEFGRTYQYIGDYATISAITLNGVALTEGTDYELERARGNDRFPYAWVIFNENKTGTLRVTGERGWAAVPSIVLATNCEMTAVRRFESPLAWVNRETGEDNASATAKNLFERNMQDYVRDQGNMIGFS